MLSGGASVTPRCSHCWLAGVDNLGMTNRMLGKLAPDHSKPALMLADHFTAPLVAPPVVDWISRVSSWPMYKNDEIGDCIAPETRVLTADLQWVSAGSLQVGDKLLGFDEEPSARSGRRFRDAVVEKVDRVMRPCYELEFADGTIVRSSAGHRWLTASTVQGQLRCQRWTRTEDLTTGPVRQSRVIKPLDVWDTDRSWEAGYLAAAFDGEGNLDQSNGVRVCFSQTANPMLDEAERCLKELGYDYCHAVDTRSARPRPDGALRKDVHRVSVATSPQVLRFLGSVRPSRLLPKLSVDRIGRIHGRHQALVRKDYIGEREVVMLDTSVRTYFAEGLASHNCVWASFGHAIQAWTTYASGQTVTLSDQAILKGYADVTGWRPDDPSTDRGTLMQDAMSYWRKVGLDGHKILAFAKVNHRNLDELRVAIALFGAVLVGIEFPHVAMEQIDEGRPWTVLPDDGGIDGGHAIHVGEYDTTLLELTTWGQVQRMTTGFVQKYADEAWVVITPEWLAATGGVSPAGLDLYGMGETLHSLTGAANPFPKPDNPPVTPPTPPVPPQPVPDPDREFAKILTPWVAKRHLGSTAGISNAAKTWLAQRGL